MWMMRSSTIHTAETNSKDELQCELNLPRGKAVFAAAGRRNRTRIRSVDEAVGQVETGMVNEVENLHTELDVSVFSVGAVLNERNIGFMVRRPGQCISAQIPL